MKLIRTLHPEVKIVDAQRGLVDYVASDETLDSYREIVSASGWKFDNFKKNAPFVDSHDYSTIEKLLGSVVSFGVNFGQLINRAKWAIDVPENKLAQIGFAMTASGHLKAVSVGFMPTVSVSRYSGDQKAFDAQVAAMKLPDETAQKVQTIFVEQQQVELSACILPANPNALAKANKDGVVTEEQLAAIGFDSDEKLNFLTLAADEYEAASPAVRHLLQKHLGEITKTKFHGQTKSEPAPAPGHAAAREAILHERRLLVRELGREAFRLALR